MNTWTVGKFRTEDIPEKDRALIEQLYGARRADEGRRRQKAAPPSARRALAWAIIEIMRYPFPEGAARHFVAEFTPQAAAGEEADGSAGEG